MTHLVDTDVLIDVTKNHVGAQQYLETLKNDWAISAITAMELIVGARNKEEAARIDEFLRSVHQHPLVSEVGTRAYGLLQEFSHSRGLRILDALIAATALDRGLTLITRNRKHFRSIPNLKLVAPAY